MGDSPGDDLQKQMSYKDIQVLDINEMDDSQNLYDGENANFASPKYNINLR